jgi:stage V sporulation protein AC
LRRLCVAIDGDGIPLTYRIVASELAAEEVVRLVASVREEVGAESVTLVFLGAALTGLGVYDRLAKLGGAGTLVPITGFANAVAAPAIEFKTEGWVTGLAVKMFTIAGPVIVYGTLASILYGLVYWVFSQ